MNVPLITNLNTRTITSIQFTSSLLVGVLSFFVSVIMIVVSSWYTFEGVQAGIQKRDSKLIWEYSFLDTIKKAIKYLITNGVYGVFTFILLAIFVGIPTLVVILLAWGVLNNASVAHDLSPVIAVLGIAFCGLLVAVLIFVVLFAYLFTAPAYLRLIASNTFSEAFHFKSNLKIAKKYMWNFIFILALVFIYTVLFGIVTGTADLISTALNTVNSTVGLISGILMEFPLMIVSTYFTFFVYTRLLGNMYRGIIEKEDDLKFLRK